MNRFFCLLVVILTFVFTSTSAFAQSQGVPGDQLVPDTPDKREGNIIRDQPDAAVEIDSTDVHPRLVELLPPAAARPVDFVKDVQPLFRKHCFECHAEGNE